MVVLGSFLEGSKTGATVWGQREGRNRWNVNREGGEEYEEFQDKDG